MLIETISMGNSSKSPSITLSWIHETIERMSSTHDADLFVLRGTHDCFCLGLDLDGFVEGDLHEDFKQALELFAALLHLLSTSSIPVVALVDGVAYGGGLGLLSVADIAIAHPKATFSLPESMHGIIPAVVFPYLVRRVGIHRANLMAIGAKAIASAEACSWGLVDEIQENLDQVFVDFKSEKRSIQVDMQPIRRLQTLWPIVPVGYEQEAIEICARLLNSEQTQSRLQRFLEGETPW